jgi:RecA-family ATPase
MNEQKMMTAALEAEHAQRLAAQEREEQEAAEYCRTHGIENPIDFLVTTAGYTLEQVRQEREQLDCSYTVMAHAAHRVMEQGFDLPSFLAEGQEELPEMRQDPFDVMQLFPRMADVQERDAVWLVEDYLPAGEICLLAGDGGVGKTSIWCDLAAALTVGKASLLDEPGTRREPKRVAVCTTEDSLAVVIKKRLRRAGANMDNVVAFDCARLPQQWAFDFTSPIIGQFCEEYRPALMVFDPIQGFVPSGVNMAARNEMRHLLAPLKAIGERTGTTFLIVCHTNKKLTSGRNRISDSSDIYDIARSVLIAGKTGEGEEHYLSHEKSNYGALQPTILFTIDRGRVRFEGFSEKRDYDFMLGRAPSGEKKAVPRYQSCAEEIVNLLTANGADKPMRVSVLDASLEQNGFSKKVIRQAKKMLRQQEQVEQWQSGGTDSHFCMQLKQPSKALVS